MYTCTDRAGPTTVTRIARPPDLSATLPVVMGATATFRIEVPLSAEASNDAWKRFLQHGNTVLAVKVSNGSVTSFDERSRSTLFSNDVEYPVCTSFLSKSDESTSTSFGSALPFNSLATFAFGMRAHDANSCKSDSGVAVDESFECGVAL